MREPRVYFITGTDTEVGKTHAACSILTSVRNNKFSTAAVKPLAAGTVMIDGGPYNEDAVALANCCSPPLTMEEINPVCLDEAIAPHIAAEHAGLTLQAGDLAGHCRQVIEKKADLTLIEGAGGWKVPLNERETMADVARILEVPVILVVGMRLGCLNHALLTAQSILADGLTLAGWIANRIDPDMPAYGENLSTLAGMLHAPLLAEIPWSENADPVADSVKYIVPKSFLSSEMI